MDCKCHICHKVIEVRKTHNKGTKKHKGFYRTTSFEGACHLHKWFCNSCLEEMRIGEVH